MVLDTIRRIIRPSLAWFLPIYARIFGSTLMKSISGERYLLNFFDSYLGTLCESQRNLEGWLRLFQELDAHSVYHLLNTIKQPVLLISGALDTITPAMQSVHIARKIPHSVHYCDPFSTHASILESPEWCLAEIVDFISHPPGQSPKQQ